MGGDFTLDEEVVRRLVERIIKLEVQQEALKRRVEEPFLCDAPFGIDDDGEGSRLILLNRLLRLEEGQRAVQKHVQELFANIMDFELQSRGEPCHLHDDSVGITEEKKPKRKWKDIIDSSLKKTNTSGLKYLAIGRSLPSRIFWALLIIISMVLTGVCIYLSYCHLLGSPTTINHARFAPLGLIAFPAVTVCPERNIGASYPLHQLLQHLDSPDLMDKLSAVMFLCPSLMMNTTIDVWSNYFNNTTPAFFEELIPLCSEDILSVHWPGWPSENCSKTFQTLYIDGRICFSFNLLPVSSMFLDDVDTRPAVMDNTGVKGDPGWQSGILKYLDASDKTIPLHLGNSGEGYKLSLMMERKPTLQSLCTDRFHAYQIAVHPPNELPSRAKYHYVKLPPGHVLYGAITPSLKNSPAESCLQGPPTSHDQMFSHYSQTNCQLQCKAKCSLNLCGCVPLDLPHLLGGKLTWEVVARYYRKSIQEQLCKAITDHLYHYPEQEGLTGEVLERLAPDCSCFCPPACSSLQYSLDTQVLPLRNTEGNWSRQNKSEVHLYYKEGQDVFTITESISVFSWLDFLGQVGGLVAFFTGLSALGLAELLYLLLARDDEPPRSPPEQNTISESCQRRRQEWDKTAQTDPLFLTDSSLVLSL